MRLENDAETPPVHQDASLLRAGSSGSALFDSFRALVLRYVNAILETPLQFFVFVSGAWFTANGVIAFGICPDMALGGQMQTRTIQFLGFIPVTVNGWHALFHLLTAWPVSPSPPGRYHAKAYAWTCGPLYLLVAALGFAGGDNVLHMMAVDSFGNIVHTIEGVIVVFTGAVSTPDGDTTRFEVAPAAVIGVQPAEHTRSR